MVKKLDTNTSNHPLHSPALEKFHLSFEYNRSWQDIRQSVRHPKATK